MQYTFTKTTKKITDFFTVGFNYFYSKLDGIIYKDNSSGRYFQNVDMGLKIPKNELKDSSWITITEQLQYRPDKIAYMTYGNEWLYWIILQHNNITNPFDLEIGKVIEIPSLSTVEAYIKTKRDNLKYR